MKTVTSRIGELEIVQIVELEIGGVLQSIITEATTEQIQQIPWLAPAYATTDGALKGVVQSFFVRIGKRNLIIDTCIGNDKCRVDIPEWSRLQTSFLQLLEQAACSPAMVTDVICTHMHMDHVGWNTTLKDGSWRPTFPNARYYFARQEYEYWMDRPAKEIADDLASFDDSVIPIVEGGLAVFVTTDEDLGDGITLVPTPGHTPAHVSVSIRTGETTILFSGDAIHHPCQLFAPQWSTDSDYARDQAAATRLALLEQLSFSSDLLAGAHFSDPSIGTVEAVLDGTFRFVGRPLV